ncbi:tyrosine-type recombinase/integrase [Agathobacter rectalis]|uniref:tyrosine-type recombinase/integrase n=1 Tax=Agathobacter rectalis TaxID=39491 RepID=UPI0027D1EB17|nr:site-specific integrase [Agathobacter rectalis]
MPKINDTGIYQLKNGYWGFRYVIVVNGQRVERRRNVDENGNPFKTKTSASKARQAMIEHERNHSASQNIILRKTVTEVYNEYCEFGRAGKAYATIKKQDSLWNNHIKAKFGKRYVDDISVAEVNDYLTELYYTENRAYTYTESFLKFFYLIFGQSYSRNYISAEQYDKLCKNKDTKIHMPKMKIDEETDIITFSDDEMSVLSQYFTGTNAETAFMLGKYCGLRINECYGLKWCNVDFKKGIIKIDRQMQYQDGVIKLVSLKTRNARREIVIATPLKRYLKKVKQHRDEVAVLLEEQREQNQTFLMDMGKSKISSLELVNSLDDGKIQTVNSMKYHTQKIKKLYGITFKYHYLRHTYGTRLAMMNTPMHILCNQMGHASGNVTQKYYLGNSKQGLELLKNNLNQMK